MNETPQAERPVPCPNCGGEGRMMVSLDMAIDAGDRSMTGQPWGCSHCNGDGWILEEARAVAPVETRPEIVIDICRELYDRFAMGGWEPQDAYPWVTERLGLCAPEETRPESELAQIDAEGYANGYTEPAVETRLTAEQFNIEYFGIDKIHPRDTVGSTAALRFAEAFRDKSEAGLREEIERLRAWKESQMAVTPDWQKIGELLNIGLGQSVTENIIPAITELRAKLAEQERIVKAYMDASGDLKPEELDKVLDSRFDKMGLNQLTDAVESVEELRTRAEAAEAELAALREREHVFGRAMIVLKGLHLSVEWELAPAIKREIAEICEQFEALSAAPERN